MSQTGFSGAFRWKLSQLRVLAPLLVAGESASDMTEIRKTSPFQGENGVCHEHLRWSSDAVAKMRVGPSKSPSRRRLQTAHCCCGRKSVVVSEWVNRHVLTVSGYGPSR